MEKNTIKTVFLPEIIKMTLKKYLFWPKRVFNHQASAYNTLFKKTY